MYLPYLQRRKRWLIEVTYDTEAVRLYGPYYDRKEALGFLASRMADATYTGPRRRDILGARVIRSKRLVDGPGTALIGHRFVQI